jgi:hypothetical protein
MMIDPAANASDERDHEPHCYQSVEAGGRYAEANAGHDSFGRDVELSVGHGAIRRFTESKLPTRRALVSRTPKRTPGRGAFHQQFICPVGRRPVVCGHFILTEHTSSRTIDLAIQENMATAAWLYRPALYCSSTKPSARRPTTIASRLSCRLLRRQSFSSR